MPLLSLMTPLAGFKEFLKHKDDVSPLIKELIIRLERQTDKVVKTVCTDGGGEFVSKELEGWFKERGIVHKKSAPHTPQQNGVAERYNRTTNEHAMAMLYDAGLKQSFWPEAHEYAAVAHGMSPSRALTRQTPDEAFSGHKPDISTLRVFGSRCHVRIAPSLRKKGDSHSLDGVFMGFARNSKAYHIWIPEKHKFVTSRDVIVYESILSPRLQKML